MRQLTLWQEVTWIDTYYNIRYIIQYTDNVTASIIFIPAMFTTIQHKNSAAKVNFLYVKLLEWQSAVNILQRHDLLAKNCQKKCKGMVTSNILSCRSSILLNHTLFCCRHNFLLSWPFQIIMTLWFRVLFFKQFPSSCY